MKNTRVKLAMNRLGSPSRALTPKASMAVMNTQVRSSAAPPDSPLYAAVDGVKICVTSVHTLIFTTQPSGSMPPKLSRDKPKIISPRIRASLSSVSHFFSAMAPSSRLTGTAGPPASAAIRDGLSKKRPFPRVVTSGQPHRPIRPERNACV